MLGVLISIVIASRVRSLKIALIFGFIIPLVFLVASMSLSIVPTDNPIGFVISIPVSMYAAYMTFHKSEERRQKSVNKTKFQNAISVLGYTVVIGLLVFMGLLIMYGPKMAKFHF